MTLPSEAIQWVQRVTGTTVDTVRELDGGSVSTVHRLAMSSGSDLAIKRFDLPDDLDDSPHKAIHEAAVLEMLAGSGVPVPYLVAVDTDGSATGVAAVLMEYVDGTSTLGGTWLEPMAEAVAAINEVKPDGLAWSYERYTGHDMLGVPAWADDPGLWNDAFDLVRSELPQTRCGFIHRDLHPGNMLWGGGRLLAVIDWMGACIGPLSIDVAHCRANLAMDHGLEVAASMLSLYLEKVPDGTWHPAWEVVDAVDFLPYWRGQESVDKWQWDSRPASETRGRFEQYLHAAMVAVEKIR